GAELFEMDGGDQAPVRCGIAPGIVILAAVQGIIRIARGGVPVPGNPKLQIELFGRLVKVIAECPAVTTVVESPVTARFVQQSDSLLVVQVPIGHMKGLREPKMRVVPVLAGEAAGAREKGRSFTEGLSIRLCIFGSAWDIIPQRFIGQVPIDGNPALLVRVSL